MYRIIFQIYLTLDLLGNNQICHAGYEPAKYRPLGYMTIRELTLWTTIYLKIGTM